MNNSFFKKTNDGTGAGGNPAKKDFSVIGFACAALLVINYGGSAGALWLYSLLSKNGSLPEGLFATGSLSLLILEAVICFAVAFPVAILIVTKNIHDTVPNANAGGSFAASPVELFVILFFAAYIGSAIGELLEGFLPAVESTSSVMPGGVAGTVVYFLVLVVLIPVAEEYFFRKVLGEALLAYGSVPAILIPALLSGFYHGNLTSLLVAFFEGLILGYIYVRTRKVAYPILVRAAVNLFAGFIPALILSLIPDTEALYAVAEKASEILSTFPSSLESFNSFIPELKAMMPSWLAIELVNGMSYGFALSGFLLFLSYFAKLKLAIGTRKLERSEIGDTVFLAPGVLAFILLSIVVIALNYSSFSAVWF